MDDDFNEFFNETTEQPTVPEQTPQPEYKPAVIRQSRQSRQFSKGSVVALVVIAAVLGGLLTGGTLLVGQRYLENRTTNNSNALLSNNQNTSGNASATNEPAVIGADTLPQISSSNPVVDIASAVGPSVVAINNIVTQDRFGRTISDTVQSSGSGVILSKNGYIVTNHHVIDGADKIKVRLSSGTELTAKLIGQDSRTDLALLKVEGDNFTPVALGDSSTVKVGELAVAIGNPLEQSGTVTAGIISGVNRTVTVDGNEWQMLQTDAAINPGNSGGALVNSKGQLIGISTVKNVSTLDEYGNTISTEGMGYAIPVNTMKSIVDTLIKNGKVSRAGLGITCQYVEANSFAGTPAGIYVTDVASSGGAAKAGLKSGDLITQLEGKEITSMSQLSKALADKKIGDKITLTVLHTNSGNTSKLVVTLTEVSG